jgi:hypothetical protein
MFSGLPSNRPVVPSPLQQINRNPEAPAGGAESRITPQDRAELVKGTIEDWVMEGHRLAQTVAYGDLGSENPAVIGPAYQRQAYRALELSVAARRDEAVK